jgi:hypothetical protein
VLGAGLDAVKLIPGQTRHADVGSLSRIITPARIHTHGNTELGMVSNE